MLRRRFLFAKVVEEKPVYTYIYTTTDGQMLDLKGVKNHKYENGIGTFETYSTNCIKFRDLDTLESIVIPKGIINIGDYVFSHCIRLTNIEIPNSVTSIGEDAFWDCTNLTSIEIPNSVTSIGTSAFSGCTGLTSVTIGNNVTIIGDYAFTKCSSLASVEIGNSVTSIGDYAFEFCSSLSSIVIPNSVISIGDGAFFYCDRLVSVTIGNNVTNIGNGAFSGCIRLKVIYNNSPLNITANSSDYGDVAYYAGAVITYEDENYDIQKDYIFHKGTEGNTLAAYIGNDSVISLPIDYNEENYSIGINAFRSCSSLTSIIIPNSVTSIGYHAFSGCSNFTSVVIGNSVTSIGDYAFYGCTQLTEISSLNSTPPALTDYTFEDIGRNGVLKIPKESDYSSWMNRIAYYLGYYDWTIEEI